MSNHFKIRLPENNKAIDGQQDATASRLIRLDCRRRDFVADLPVEESESVQLGPGTVEYVSRRCYGRDLVIMSHQVAPKLAIHTVPSRDWIILLMSMNERSNFVFNGRLARPFDLLLSAGYDGYMTTGEERRNIAIAVRRIRLISACAALAGVGVEEVTLRDLTLSLEQDMGQRLRRLLISAATSSGGELLSQGQFAMPETLENDLISMLAAQLALTLRRFREANPFRVDALRVVRAANAALEALPAPSLAELCGAAGISERWLHKCFVDIFGVPPYRYIRLARLSKARELLLASQGQPALVKSVALSFGYRLSGRFAAEYRSVFAENPSDTLQRAGESARASLRADRGIGFGGRSGAPASSNRLRRCNKHWARFEDRLEDRPMEYNELHDLMDIVLLVICAIVGGAESWEAIEEFGKEKLEWLRQFAPLAKGVPSHEVIAGVISRLSLQGFQQCFTSWTGAVTATRGGKPIAVDGKTTRGLRHLKRGHKALRGLSAWADTNRLVLGHAMTEEKSNEIAAISKSLQPLELSRCIVTLDATVCPRRIAAQIIGQGGDYVLGLNDHQSAMRQAVEDFFSMAGSGDFAEVSHDCCVEEVDQDRGRLEMRRYWITEELRILPEAAPWMGLRSIGMVERLCSIGGGDQSVERHFFLSSIAAEATRFASAVRGRWGVENRLHWRLDVVFSEDARRIGTGNASALLTPIRRLCLSLFECEPSSLRLSQKRRKAAWNDDYRAKVVFG